MYMYLRMYLVAADDVDDDEHVGGGDEPSRLLEGDEDVVVDGVAEDVVADEGDGEVRSRWRRRGRRRRRRATWASWTVSPASTGSWPGSPAPRCAPRTRTPRRPARSGS